MLSQLRRAAAVRDLHLHQCFQSSMPPPEDEWGAPASRLPRVGKEDPADARTPRHRDRLRGRRRRLPGGTPVPSCAQRSRTPSGASDGDAGAGGAARPPPTRGETVPAVDPRSEAGDHAQAPRWPRRTQRTCCLSSRRAATWRRRASRSRSGRRRCSRRSSFRCSSVQHVAEEAALMARRPAHISSQLLPHTAAGAAPRPRATAGAREAAGTSGTKPSRCAPARTRSRCRWA